MTHLHCGEYWRFCADDRQERRTIRCSPSGTRRSAFRRLARSSRSTSRPRSSRRSASIGREIDAIAREPAAANFDNTVAALERSGKLLSRVSNVFYVLAGAHTSEPIQAIERDMAPVLARHWNEIHLNDKLFVRLDALHKSASGLSAEQARVLERYHALFRRAGAGLDSAAKQRLKEIGDRLATLGTTFGQNVLADEQAYVMPLGEADLAGLPDFAVAAARGAAEERDLPGHAVTLGRSSVEPFLQFSARRDLREKAFAAWIARGDTGGKTDNKAVDRRAAGAARREGAAARLSELRALQARRHHGQKAGGRLRPARRRLGAGAAPRRRGAGRPAGAGGGRGRQLPPRAVGLALLRREAAQGALRPRRERDQAVPAARPDHRGGLLHGEPAVRPRPSRNAATCRSIIRTSASGR